MLDVYSPVNAEDWLVVIVLHGSGDAKWFVSDLARVIVEQRAIVFTPTFQASAPSNASWIGLGEEETA